MAFDLRSLEYPIVQAPMAGGPLDAGARGRGLRRGRPRLPRRRLLAPPAAPRGRPRRDGGALTDERFGVNLFLARAVLAGRRSRRWAAFAARIGADACAPRRRRSGEPHFDDDELGGQADVVVCGERAGGRVVHVRLPLRPRSSSGCTNGGIAAWVTVTEVDEALAARSAPAPMR